MWSTTVVQLPPVAPCVRSLKTMWGSREKNKLCSWMCWLELYVLSWTICVDLNHCYMVDPLRGDPGNQRRGEDLPADRAAGSALRHQLCRKREKTWNRTRVASQEAMSIWAFDHGPERRKMRCEGPQKKHVDKAMGVVTEHEDLCITYHHALELI